MSINVVEPSDSSNLDQPAVLRALSNRARGVVARFPSASQGVFSIFDQAVVSGTSFLTAMIIGRSTSQQELGLYYLMMSIVVVISGIQDQLVASPFAVYSKRRRGNDLAEYSGSIWVHNLLISLVVVLGLLTVAVVCAAGGNHDLVPGLLTLAVAGPLLLLRESVRRFTFANLHVKAAILLDVIVAFVQLGGILAAWYFGRLTLVNIFTIAGAACALACTIGWLVDRPTIRFVPGRYLSDWHHNWVFGKWALRSFLVGSTSGPIMLWLLKFLSGDAAAGVLGACATIIGLTNVIMSGVSNVLTPQAAHAYVAGGPQALRRILNRTAFFFAVTLGGFALLVLFTGDLLAVLVFGGAYRGCGLVLFALALGAMANGLGMVAGNGLWAIHQPRFNFIADVLCLTITLACGILLIGSLGALGAALAPLAGATAAVVIRTVVFARQLETTSNLPADATVAAAIR
jgi:O-antigen/teichoic acid export membrane protein